MVIQFAKDIYTLGIGFIKYEFQTAPYYFILEIVGIFILIGICYLWYFGLFKTIRSEFASFGPAQFLYEDFQGTYDKLEAAYQKMTNEMQRGGFKF